MVSAPRFLDVHGDTSRPRGLSFQQYRVALFLRILSTFFGLFVVLGGVKTYFVVQSGNALWIESTRFGGLVFGAIFVLVVAMWMYARSRPREARTLDIIDSAGTVVTCGALTAMIPFIPTGTAELGMLFVLILVLVVRASIVPSTGRRTLLVGILATAPLAITFWVRGAGLDMETEPIARFAGLIVLVWGMIFSVATLVISRVIYGLRTKLKSLGSYELVEKLGTGGMGDVWRAQHQMLARPAAIKMVRADAVGGSGTTSASFERFEKEAQATAALTCPNTIHLFDFGRAEDGSFYYVMELLDGIDLERLVDRYGPQKASRVRHILVQICRSLHEAHLAGLVHRDIKPANVLICRYGAELDFVKVLDFGLVKHHAEPIDTGITRDGVTVGTPAYMAPEMVMGDREVDGRTDLYGLGCVAYWLLTGTRVFEAENPTALLVKHASDEPEPLSARTELDIPAELERLVMACLHKKPEDRPASALELRRELAALDLHIDWNEEDAAVWWQKHHPT